MDKETIEMIPRLDAKLLRQNDPETLKALAKAAKGVGFVTVHNTSLSKERVEEVIEVYRRFFKSSDAEKSSIDMAKTGANRGWGASGSEQVDPNANPDYKQYFDSGHELAPDHELRKLSVYAPNQWPQNDPEFKRVILAYYKDAMKISLNLLRSIATALEMPDDYFDKAFETPMALMRGNFYPERPKDATSKDFGIATHTDYGCLTLLATDGSPGLEVRKRGGGWIPVSAPPGEFIINFGEMMEFWTDGVIKATPHRVQGGHAERISVPLFFNPFHETNVAPLGSGEVVLAGDHLEQRFKETYLHLQSKG